MPIPDYQTVMLPLLKYASDDEEHSLREFIDALADSFGLSEAVDEAGEPDSQFASTRWPTPSD